MQVPQPRWETGEGRKQRVLINFNVNLTQSGVTREVAINFEGLSGSDLAKTIFVNDCVH